MPTQISVTSGVVQAMFVSSGRVASRRTGRLESTTQGVCGKPRRSGSVRAVAAFVVTLPASLLGSLGGILVYRRMFDVNFRRAVFVMLTISGATLVAKAAIAF